MTVRAIGLMSGTSADGIDAALVEITGTEADLQITLLAGKTSPYPKELRAHILEVCAGKPLSMAEFAELDEAIARAFARAALAIQKNLSTADFIGSHGQTVYHCPPDRQTKLGYSLQLGRGDTIAHLTGLPTISNFRAADLAVGGQGAPLVSRIDACLLSHPQYHCCVQNIGGIGNLTYLPPTDRSFDGVLGWDTGPGNSLLDLAVQHLSEGKQTYDQNGEWAASGTPCLELVEQWMQHPYFGQSPPKSTGRELFGWDFFQNCLVEIETRDLIPADFLATLTEFTARSIVHSYRQFLPKMPDRVMLCGGGSCNAYLRQRLKIHLGKTEVLTTDEAGLNSQFKEAIAFAVLAYWRTLGIPGNLPSVTGAKQSILLGEISPVAREPLPGIKC
ncbi:MAG: anhydro-N-acetylmuramic acid kinase [Geitlerinemataceae cyanobacterium]